MNRNQIVVLVGIGLLIFLFLVYVVYKYMLFHREVPLENMVKEGAASEMEVMGVYVNRLDYRKLPRQKWELQKAKRPVEGLWMHLIPVVFFLVVSFVLVGFLGGNDRRENAPDT